MPSDLKEALIAKLREAFESLATEWGWDLRREANDPDQYLLRSTDAAWGGFLACANLFEETVKDAERYRWLRSDDIDVPQGQAEIYVVRARLPFNEDDTDEVLTESALDDAVDARIAAAPTQQQEGGS